MVVHIDSIYLNLPVPAHQAAGGDDENRKKAVRLLEEMMRNRDF